MAHRLGWSPVLRTLRLAVPLALVGAAGCGPGDADRVADGAAIYAEKCARCHGAMGEGNVGPSLRNWSRGQSALVAIINDTMPFDAPGSCTGDCALDVARYILITFVGELACDPSSPAPRGLRLLTRREYANTVADLLGIPVMGPPSGGGSCAPTPFTFDPKAQTYKTVHVAGSFNGWPGTIAGGGWAMTFSSTTHTWSTTHALAAGQYTYKLVLDESTWIADPANPNSAPDGFGGQNSVLTVSCSSPAADPTANFPPEVRPQGFAFDDHGPARAVTAVHVEQYQTAAATLATRAAQSLDHLVGCDYHADAAGCAATFVGRFGLRAFRRPLSPTELGRYRDLIVAQSDFAKGVTLAVRAMLGSPSFLYRSELGDAQPDGSFRLSPYEVASALSYQLWATMPDQALFDAAAAGELDRADGIEKQARRLLADPRARDVIATFAEQWLGAENVSTVDKRSDLFPSFTTELRRSLREETRRFVAHVVFDGAAGYDELVTANYSMLDATAASFYGAAGPTGADFVPTAIPDGQRAGVLGQAAILAATAHSDQTSPVKRGLFVRRALLCQEFPTPPPNAGGLPSVDPTATTRERFSQHSSQGSCAQCHKYIDPVGFGFERFDPIGLARATENGKPIDASGDMNDVEGLGTATSAPFSSLPALGQRLAASQRAHTCFVRQYFRFGRGYLDGADDRCAIEALRKRFEAGGWNIRELMVGVTLLPEFVVRR
jgi:hypothetical protein